MEKSLKINLTHADYQDLYKAISIIEQYEELFREKDFQTHRNVLHEARCLLIRISNDNTFYNMDND